MCRRRSQICSNRYRSPIPFGEPNADRLIEDLIRTVLTLRYVRVNESVAQVSQMQEDLQSQGEAKLKPYYELFSPVYADPFRLIRPCVRP